MKALNLQTLMALVCNTSCGATPVVPTSFYDGCTDITRTFGFNHFILVQCDYAFTDILDASEWTTAIAADKIHIGPAGNLVINQPTANAVKVEGCGREVLGTSTITVDFTTYQFGGTTLANVPDSFQYWKDLLANSTSYRLMFVDCNGLFFVDDDWMAEIGAGTPATIAGSSPGFEFSISGLPAWIAGEEDLGLWSTQFTIKKSGILEAAFLPGVQAVLA